MKEYFVWLLKVLTVAVVVVLVFGTIMAMKQAGRLSSDEFMVAVVELKGQILDTKEVVDQLYEQVDDEDIRGVVLRIDSPGGAVGPSQEVFRAVQALKNRKPIVVSMGSLAASGGLYAALSASKVYAHPGTLTGSIGVIGQSPELTKITEKLGIQMRTIKSGKLKDVGNPFREMTEDDRVFLQQTMDEIHRQFIDDVASGRNLPIEQVKEFADGRVLTGTQAKEVGLVDEFGGVHDAARAVFDLIEEPLAAKESPTLIYTTDKFSQFKELLTKASRVLSVMGGEYSQSRIQAIMP